MIQDARIVGRDNDIGVADPPRTFARNRHDSFQKRPARDRNQWFARQALRREASRDNDQIG
jgi:hypothetical protein